MCITTVPSVIASLKIIDYSIQMCGEVQFLPQNAPENAWQPGSRPTGGAYPPEAQTL